MGKIEVGAKVKWDERSKSRPVKVEVVRDRDRRSEPLPPPPPAREERKKIRQRSPVGRVERRSRSRSRSRNSYDSETDIILRLPREDAKHLTDRAQVWHERQLRVVGARIKALKKKLGYDDDGKSKTRRVVMARNKKKRDERELEKMERDERQLDSWKAARDALNELEPSASLREALEVLYLGPLINTMQHLDGINDTQTELADLQAQVDTMKRRLRKVESDISESRKKLEEKDDWLRKRMWKCFYYNRQFLCGFEDP